MDTITSAMRRTAFDVDPVPPRAGHDHAVSWQAVLAGAAGAASLSLILLVLGTGLGLSSISPWTDHGVSATALSTSTIVWITLTQLAASALGGYLAGRLRGRWSDTQLDEVYFRDTAHGFLAWAVATLLTAALLTSVTASILDTGAKTGAALAAGGATAALAQAMPAPTGNEAKTSNAYYVDSLFRPDVAAVAAAGAAASAPVGSAPSASNASNAEATAIFMNAIKAGSLPQDDAAYLGQMVSRQTGMSAQDGQRRVVDTFARMQNKAQQAETAARDAADKARKASAYAALWLFVSLLLGAFGASLAATFGGRQRDLP